MFNNGRSALATRRTPDKLRVGVVAALLLFPLVGCGGGSDDDDDDDDNGSGIVTSATATPANNSQIPAFTGHGAPGGAFTGHNNQAFTGQSFNGAGTVPGTTTNAGTTTQNTTGNTGGTTNGN